MAIAITAHGTAVTENFNTLANSGISTSLPPDWVAFENNAPGDGYSAGTGSSATGDTYSFGDIGSTDRALGGLRSASLAPLFGASLVNRTGSSITSLAMAYNGEQWRLGATGRVDRLDFQYSLNATDITNGVWNDVNALDFTAPITTGAVGQTLGNTDGRTAIAGNITPLNIPDGATFWIRWIDLNVTGANDGLGIDDFSLTSAGPANTPPSIGAIANVATRSYEPVTSASFAVSDTETAAGSLSVTYTSSNPTLIPVANITTGGTGATRTATLRPAGPSGTSTITARVTDGGGLFSETSFTVTVNAAPTLDIGNVSGNPGDSIQIPITLTTNGVPASAILGIDIALLYDTNALQISSATLGPALPSASWAVFSNTLDPGKMSISLSTFSPISTDFSGIVAYIPATIKTTAPAGASPVNMVKTAVINGTTVNTWVNEDFLPLGPNPTSASVDPITDGIVTVNAPPNQPPVNTYPAGPVIGTEDVNVNFTASNAISVADADAAIVTTTISVPSTAFGTFTATTGGGSAALTFSNSNATVQIVGAPAQVNLALGTLVFVPAANRNFAADGAITVSVITTDGTATDSDSFAIHLNAINYPPDAVNLSISTAFNSPVSSTLPATDPDGPTLTFALTSAPLHGTVSAFNSATGAFTYTPSSDTSGTDTFTFSVTDGTSTDIATVQIKVQRPTPVITASAGNITVDGTGNEDVIIVSAAGAGFVRIRTQSFGGVGSSAVYPLSGSLTINTGNAADHVVLSGLTVASAIYAGDGDDSIFGAAGNDYIQAGAGNDVVSAGSGNDRLYGGSGSDRLVGGNGDDIISAGDGNDQLLGQGGNDLLIGGIGADNIQGGQGNDLLIANDTSGSSSSAAGDANDLALVALLASWNSTHGAGIASGIVLADDGVVDTLTGSTGDDDFYASATDVLTDFNQSGAGTDRRFP